MKVVVLCGGQGTRLREETEYRPKPLVDVGGRPILWHIMKIYAHYGFDDFLMCLGYRGNMIKEYFLNYETMNSDFTICLGDRTTIQYHNTHKDRFRVTLADTGLESMTGGRLKRAAAHLDSDTFLVTYGDGVADVNVRELVRFHESHGKIATVTTVRPYSRFGVLEVGDGGRIARFAEKPQLDGWVNAGYFVFHRRILDYIDSDDSVLEREPFEALVAEGELMAYRHEGFFFAMDTYREYLQLNEMWNSNAAPWKVWS